MEHTSSIHRPKDIQLIGDTVAVLWSDGREDYLPMERLRAASPSAENMGEADLFGRVRGGDPRKQFPGVEVRDFEYVGAYAVRFIFSDGHNTGLYTFRYLRTLSDHWKQQQGEEAS